MEMTLNCCGTFKYSVAQEVMTNVVKKNYLYVFIIWNNKFLYSRRAVGM